MAKQVMVLVEELTHQEVIGVVSQKGGGGKTFLQNYIKYYYTDQHVIATDMATNVKNLVNFLT